MITAEIANEIYPMNMNTTPIKSVLKQERLLSICNQITQYTK